MKKLFYALAFVLLINASASYASRTQEILEQLGAITKIKKTGLKRFFSCGADNTLSDAIKGVIDNPHNTFQILGSNIKSTLGKADTIINNAFAVTKEASKLLHSVGINTKDFDEIMSRIEEKGDATMGALQDAVLHVVGTGKRVDLRKKIFDKLPGNNWKNFAHAIINHWQLMMPGTYKPKLPEGGKGNVFIIDALTILFEASQAGKTLVVSEETVKEKSLLKLSVGEHVLYVNNVEKPVYAKSQRKDWNFSTKTFWKAAITGSLREARAMKPHIINAILPNPTKLAFNIVPPTGGGGGGGRASDTGARI